MDRSRVTPPPAAPPELPNGDPVLAMRLEPPLPPETFLSRERLNRRLDEGTRLPVTLVNGPAGAGKTLLVADWLRQGRAPGPVAWLTVEAGDNLPGNFWAYVLRALDRSGLDVPAGIGDPAQADHVEPSLLVRLAAWLTGLPEPPVLVLDEFEQVTDPVVAEHLDALLRHTRGHLRLVLVSRSEPLLPLHRYRAAGELAEIRAADLALLVPEAAEVLERHGLRPGPAAVEAVHRQVSGWTAGLRLLALAARNAEDPEAYLKRIDAEQQALSDFLLAEVLRTQPEPTQDLLLRCSVVPLVQPDLADALTGRRDAGRILGELHRANAFVELLPEGWYRLHPMFAEILRLHLRAARPDLPGELHARAAHWFAEQGQQQAALEHAAAAGAWEFAARLVIEQLALAELFTGRDTGRLRTLFSAMPPTVGTPAAELVRAALHLAQDEAAAGVRSLERAEDRLPAGEPAFGLAAACLRTVAGRLLGSGEMAEAGARRAHAFARTAPQPALRRHPELLTQVDADLGSALLWEGRLEEAGEALAAAAQASASPVNARLRHDAQCRLALIDCLRGWPGRAERRVHQADEEADRVSLPAESRTEVGQLVLAAAALEREELAAARGSLARAAASGQVRRDPLLALGLAVVGADLQVAQGNPAAALKVLDRTERTEPAEGVSPWARERLAVAASAAHLAAGRPEAALEAVAEVPVRAPDSVVAVARVRLAAGQAQESTLDRLAELRDDPSVGAATRARALLLLAQGPEESGEPGELGDPGKPGASGDKAAGRLLAQALAAAEGEGLRRPFHESAGWVRRQLRRHRDLARAHPWLPSDLCPPDPSGAAAAPPREASEPPVVPPVEQLTEREREVLSLAARLMSTQEIADELFLSANTVKTHLKSIHRKLGTTRRREAVRRGVELGVLEGP